MTLASLIDPNSQDARDLRKIVNVKPLLEDLGTLLAEYRFEETSGVVAFDTSGNGRDGAYVGAPTLTGTGFTPNGGTKYATYPDAVWQGWQTAIIVHDVRATVIAGCMLGSSNAGGMAFCDASINGNSWSVPSVAVGATTARGYEAAPVGVNVFALVSDLASASTSDKIYIDGHEPVMSPGYVNQVSGSGAARLGTGQIGAHTGLSLGTNSPILYAAFFADKLTTAQIQAATNRIKNYLSDRGNNLLSPLLNVSAKYLVGIGDSITFGQAASSWTSLMTALTNPAEFTILRFGFGGIGAAQAAFNMRQLLSHGNTPASPKRIAVVYLGTNDITSGGSAAATLDRIAACCQSARREGFKVVVANMISRTGQETGKNALNALINANYAKWADALADLGANANIGADGACNNTTYFQTDKVHPTTAGQQIVADIISAAVNTLTLQ